MDQYHLFGNLNHELLQAGLTPFGVSLPRLALQSIIGRLELALFLAVEDLEPWA
jgi:hypothetical protein